MGTSSIIGISNITSADIVDGAVARPDVDIITVGSSLIRKVVAGAGISLASTGADAGTGDVTITATGASSARVRTGVSDADYAILTSDDIVAVTALSVTRTLTLPTAAAAGAGKFYTIVDESGSASGTVSVIIDGNGAETIDGSTTLTMDIGYGSVNIYCTGSGWKTF